MSRYMRRWMLPLLLAGTVPAVGHAAKPAAPSGAAAGLAPGSGNQRWVLQDAGANCRRVSSPGKMQIYGDSIVNDQGTKVDVLCPVSLGGQFDGFDKAGKQVVFHHATVPVARAVITVVNSDPKQSITCSAVATASDGTVLTSRPVTAVGSKDLTQKLQLAPLGNWGGTLGTGRDRFPIRSLSYQCTMPAGTAIQRYVTAVCQNNADCQGPDAFGHGMAGVPTRVQHNGTECVAHDAAHAPMTGSLIYSESGIRLSPAASSTEFTQVACPLSAASGDSQMAPATFQRVDVFMTGARLSPTAVPCKVVTLDERNAEADFIGQEEFKFDAKQSVWSWTGRRNAKRRNEDEGWPSVYLNCFLVPGAGIAGVVTTQELGPRWPKAAPPAPVQPPKIEDAAW